MADPLPHRYEAHVKLGSTRAHAQISMRIAAFHESPKSVEFRGL